MQAVYATQKKKTIVTVLVLTVLIMTLLPLQAAKAADSVPYDTYTYDYWETIIFTPAPYIPGETISGVSLGVGALNDPQGIYVASDDSVYIADTGNNRILVLEQDLKTVRDVIVTFDNNGTTDSFNKPRGVMVTGDGTIYVADTENRRVIALAGGKVVKTIENPQAEILGENFDFVPLKVTVDYAGRVFVIARDMFQGIMTFGEDGEFIGFYGTINVTITLWERFWRALSTQEQRARGRLFIPTVFTGLDVDPAGFVYASNIDGDGKQAVRRLNPKGEDVLRKGSNEHVGGDIALFGSSASAYSGPSNIIDVAYRGNGMYSLLDSRRGRIFTYDYEGNLLYIFGGMGQLAGTFRQPTAIAAQKDRVLALDAVRNELITFEETLYGELINEAVALRYGGDEAQAVEVWQQVLRLNENFELANAGIGKAYLTAGENELAMEYLKKGMDKQNYSIAFKRWRNDILKENIGWILTAALCTITAFTVVRVVLKKRKGSVQDEGGDVFDA
ncbi:MAG: NHL repeat-containing protein [Oscillospiraceae bacterium]|nr:NHL repeat-containing protein [Oscillospiraceae bacterium]